MTTVEELFNKTDAQERKEAKLKHYGTRDIHEFYQLDGFIDTLEDSVMHPDTDGDCLFGGKTEELMTGVTAVRILITKGTKAADALRVIHKLEKWLEHNPELVTDENWFIGEPPF